MKYPNKQRADDQTVLAVSLPKILKERIKKAAKADKRSVSNWVVVTLEELIDASPKVAEDATKYITKKFFSTPHLGTVTAGHLTESYEDNSGKTVDVPREMFGNYNPEDFFCLDADGESMIDFGINPGDTMLIRRTKTAVAGDIVIALVEGENTVKQLLHSNGKITLKPGNKDFEPITIDSDKVEIQGVYFGVV